MSPQSATGHWDERTSAAESSVFNNQDMFQKLFERSADAILLFDPARQVFIDCNQAAVELMRATNKEQLLLQHPAELSPEFQPDGTTSRDKTPEVISIALAQGSHRFEWMARGMDGSVFPLEVLLTTLQNGEQPLMATVCREITERKRAEREIRELNALLEQRVNERTAALMTSEARLRAVVEHAPEAIVVFDGITGRFLFGNEHACHLYGVPMEKLTELTPADVSPEFQPSGRRSSEHARELMEEALAGGMPVVEWVHRQQPDGRLISTEVRLLRLPAEGQNLIRASIIDNGERKRAEIALRESEQKYRALFQESSLGVVLHDEHAILEVNPAAVRIMRRRSADEMVGKHPSEMAPLLQSNGKPSAEMGKNFVEECMAHGSARFDWVASTPAGEEIPLEVALTRIQWSGRQVIQAIIKDITERKRAEVEMLKALAREKELGQLKSNFVSMVSHEFRTPLGIIQSSAELLREFHQNMQPGEREEQLESVARNTRRMAGMMEGVLVLSRLEAGKLDFHPAPLNLNFFSRRIVDEVVAATNRRCVIELTANALPAAAQADEQLLAHIFTNLLSNAVKYSEEGATVRFTVEQEGQEAVCVIRDRGIGISVEDQRQLFKAFNRGSNVGTRSGTGLGLLLVKRCTELHGGSVKVESKIGDGTTVTVRLPVFPKAS
jgi:PAS domain S-box-containing protein